MTDLAVCRWLLRLCDPEGAAAMPDVRLAGDEVGRLIQLARAQGVAGAVLRNLRRIVEQQDASLLLADPRDAAATAVAVQFAEQARLPELAHSMLLRVLSRSALRWQRRAGLEAAVVKGEDFADRLYPSADLRTFRNVDLLVRSVDADLLGDVLDAQGWRCAGGGRRSEQDGPLRWENSERRGMHLDVHRNLVRCPTLQCRAALTWDNLLWDEAEDRWAASPESMLAIACGQAAVDARVDRLRRLCDIRQLCRGRAGEIRVPTLREIAVRSNAAAAVAAGLEMTARLLQDDDSREILSKLGLPQSAPPWRLVLSPLPEAEQAASARGPANADGGRGKRAA